jgi:hypothetical protein
MLFSFHAGRGDSAISKQAFDANLMLSFTVWEIIKNLFSVRFSACPSDS